MRFELPWLSPAQQLVFNDPHRYRIVLACRRFGKNYLCAVECLKALLEGKIVWHVSPDQRTGMMMYRTMRHLISGLEAKHPELVRTNDTDMMIRLPGLSDGYFQVRSAEANLRGEGINYLTIDEVILIKNFLEILEGDLRPALATTQGRMMIISSVWGYDDLWNLYTEAKKPENSAEWASWRFTIYDAYFIKPPEIENLKKTMTASRFAREFMSEPQADGGVFHLDNENKSAALQQGAIEDHTYVIGADIGGAVDNTAYAVADVTTQEIVCVDAFLNPSYSAQIERLRDLCQRFKPKLVVIEENNAGKAFIQQCHEAGIHKIRALTTSNATKAAQVESLTLDFEQHRFRIPNDDDLIKELNAFESSRTPSGLVKYAAARGHDDRVMSLLLAHAAAKTDSTPSAIQIQATGLYGSSSQDRPPAYSKQPQQAEPRGALWLNRSHGDDYQDRPSGGLWRGRR